MLDAASVSQRVEAQISKIPDPNVVTALRKFIVTPRCELRDWDYGEPGEQFPCWIIFEHAKSNACIAYCDQGFGPATPWGLLYLSGKNRSMGMDCNWFDLLEDAFRSTRAWEGGV